MEKITKWLPVVLGILVMLTGLPKLIGAEMAIENFKTWNLGDNMRIVTGLLELILGLAIVFRPTRSLAGLGFLMVTSAGFIIHIASNQFEMLWMPLVFGGLTFWMMVNQGYLKLK